MDKKRSLSLLVSFWSAVGIASAMAIYAVIQYFTWPGASATQLFVTHLWHVLVLGLVIYAIMRLVFGRVVLKPINRINRHLYGVSTGRIVSLKLQSGVTEIDKLVAGINVMTTKMAHNAQSVDPAGEIAAIRTSAKTLYTDHPQEVQKMLGHLARLQQSVPATTTAEKQRLEQSA